MNKKKEISSYVYVACYVSVFCVIGRILHGVGVLYLELVAYSVLAIVGVVLLREYYREAINKWKEKPLTCILWIVGASFVHLILENVMAIPLYLYNPDYVPKNTESVSNVRGIVPMWIAVIVLGVLGPMVEEHIYRVFIVRKQEEHLPASFSIILSAICFMMLHAKLFTLEEIFANLPILASGLVYGLVAYKSKNITVSMIMHFMNNIPAIIALYM